MNLNTIIEKKKEEFDKKFGITHGNQELPEKTWEYYGELQHFLEKAIRESVEEALREVTLVRMRMVDENTYRGGYNKAVGDMDEKVKKFMK